MRLKVSLNREMLRLAIPNILSNISVPLLSTVDTALMGRESTEFLAAVGLGSMAFSFLYWNFGFLRMGTTGITAQALGRDDDDEVSRTFWRSVIIAIGIALLLIVLKNPIFSLAGNILAVGPSLHSDFITYLSIRIWAAPATLLLYVLFGWFFGLQNSRVPLIITILSNIVNIALSYYLVVALGWGIRGVAIGTVVGQYIGLLAILIWAFYKRGAELMQALNLAQVMDTSTLLSFLRIQKDLFLRTVMLTLAFAYFYRYSSQTGELALAANIVLLQFINWASYGIDGFAYAAESMVGKYFGRKDEKKLLASTRLSFIWGLGLGCLACLGFVLFQDSLLRIFTTDEEVISFSKKLYHWVLIIPMIAAASYIWDGIFVGLTRSKAMRDSMFIAIVFYAILVYIGTQIYGINSTVIWLGLTVFLLIRGIVQSYQFWHSKMWQSERL